MQLEILTALFPEIEWNKKCHGQICQECCLYVEVDIYNLFPCLRDDEGRFYNIPLFEYAEKIIKLVQDRKEYERSKMEVKRI